MGILFMSITKKELRRLFSYRDDGVLVRMVSAGGGAKAGDVVGCLNSAGYLLVKINNKIHRVHRLVYIYHKGIIPHGLHVDHRNRIRSDNRIENLRVVTRNENQWNRSNVKGYSWNKKSGKWIAQITLNNKTLTIGSYSNEDEARNAYLQSKTTKHIIKNR